MPLFVRSRSPVVRGGSPRGGRVPRPPSGTPRLRLPSRSRPGAGRAGLAPRGRPWICRRGISRSRPELLLLEVEVDGGGGRLLAEAADLDPAPRTSTSRAARDSRSRRSPVAREEGTLGGGAGGAVLPGEAQREPRLDVVPLAAGSKLEPKEEAYPVLPRFTKRSSFGAGRCACARPRVPRARAGGAPARGRRGGARPAPRALDRVVVRGGQGGQVVIWSACPRAPGPGGLMSRRSRSRAVARVLRALMSASRRTAASASAAADSISATRPTAMRSRTSPSCSSASRSERSTISMRRPARGSPAGFLHLRYEGLGVPRNSKADTAVSRRACRRTARVASAPRPWRRDCVRLRPRRVVSASGSPPIRVVLSPPDRGAGRVETGSRRGRGFACPRSGTCRGWPSGSGSRRR